MRKVISKSSLYLLTFEDKGEKKFVEGYRLYTTYRMTTNFRRKICFPWKTSSTSDIPFILGLWSQMQDKNKWSNNFHVFSTSLIFVPIPQKRSNIYIFYGRRTMGNVCRLDLSSKDYETLWRCYDSWLTILTRITMPKRKTIIRVKI